MGTPRILYIVGQLDRGGAEQQLYYLLKHLRPRATVLSLSESGYWAEPIRQLGYEVIELKRRGHADFSRLLAVTKFIRYLEPDVVHVFMDGESGLYGRVGALLARHPRVIVGERRHPTLDPSWYSLLKRLWLNRRVQAIVANAQSSRDYLINHDGLAAERAQFIPNGLEVDGFSDNGAERLRSMLPESWRDKVIVGTVGSLCPRKSPATYLKVARRVIEQHSNVRFIHIGDGPMRAEMERLSSDFGIHDSINFLGLRNDVPRWLRSMDVFVLTSANEGTPNAAMEAMAVGLPCVVTDTGDCRHLVRDGETGFVVPVGDETQMVERILGLIRDECMRREMGRKGKERVRAFDVKRMAEEYRNLYSSMMNGNSLLGESGKT